MNQVFLEIGFFCVGVYSIAIFSDESAIWICMYGFFAFCVLFLIFACLYLICAICFLVCLFSPAVAKVLGLVASF